MSTESSGEASAKEQPTRWTAWTLIALLVLYPCVYCSGVMGELVRPIISEHSRTHWWYFWFANMAFHWIPFGLVWWTLRQERQPWSSVGVDWGWFQRSQWWWIGILSGLIAGALFLPAIHYQGEFPGISQTVFMAPVSTLERLWVIWGAVTAAVTEEVLFRGFALTRLPRYVRSVWLALCISVISFVFIHGTPRSPEQATSYAIAGLAFGIPFLWMKLKRLEILIAIHFLIDATMVLAP